ncbi:endolytic transglycosylase MltG [Patescibacteria group bacterium]
MSRNKLLIILIIILLIAVFFWLAIRSVTKPHGNDNTAVDFIVEQGWGVKRIATELLDEDFIESTFVFETYVWLEGASSELQAGNFNLQRNMSVQQIVNVLSGGQTISNERVVKFIEGWNSNEIATYLSEQGIMSAEEFLAAVNTSDSRDLIPGKEYTLLGSKPASANLEGYLFPDTYRIFKDSSAASIIQRQLDALHDKISEDVMADIEASGNSFYEILIMASIIEKEVRTDRDREIAADIFWRRLEAGIALEADSTVNYITGKSTPAASADDLEVDSPYNTYLYRGLPPGPITNPSLSSIRAAIYPESNNYWYFLTKPDGTTVFSKNFEEHKENKSKYL